MTTREIIENKLAEKKVTINWALFLDYNETETRITVYDMNITTFAKNKVAHYLVPFKNLILA